MIFCSIMAWPGSEQANIWVVEITTPGMRPISSATRLTSTTSEMFPPQWQTKTPIRGSAVAPFPETCSACVLSLMSASPENLEGLHVRPVGASGF